jgi:Lon protease-like protein
MTNFIPIFPLSIVVYPGEDVNLHIFEQKYKQLITECSEQNKPFGIPVVIDNKMNEIGSLVDITEITKTYDNGEMDIRTRGKSIFRILEVIKDVPEKLYSGAIVSHLEDSTSGKQLLMEKVVAAVKELHRLLQIKKPFLKKEKQLTSYDVAHHAGLTLEGEYELLSITNELQRQEYLKRHLTKVLPVVAEMEALKKKIRMNGHFKNLSSFNIP